MALHWLSKGIFDKLQKQLNNNNNKNNNNNNNSNNINNINNNKNNNNNNNNNSKNNNNNVTYWIKLYCVIFKPLHYSHGNTDGAQSSWKVFVPSPNAKSLSNDSYLQENQEL